MTEADSLPEDGPAASAIRSLMSDREMSYEVVEKGDDGVHKVRKIVKPGPTGVITTAIKPLGDQASTRTLTVSIADSMTQTRLILRVQADRANLVPAVQDLRKWIAAQRWLELAGERRVVIPFAHVLADLVPANSVRMRRDFAPMLTVIKSIAFLYQNQRERDDQGRIIATIDDYISARWVLEEVFATTVGEGVTPAIKETVEGVEQLSTGGNAVTQSQLADRLGLSKSTIHYRVERAIQGGWLVNQTMAKGAPARMVIGEPLPEGNPLPHSDELTVCAEDCEIPSNLRTQMVGTRIGQGSIVGSNPAWDKFESDPEAESEGTTRGFEGFEPSHGEPTHTTTQGTWRQGELPEYSSFEEGAIWPLPKPWRSCTKEV